MQRVILGIVATVEKETFVEVCQIPIANGRNCQPGPIEQGQRWQGRGH